MKRLILLFIIVSLVSLLSLVSAKQAQNNKFELNAPKDWRSETIPFPLDFAPEIKYKGFEELRFAPGMFKRESNTYFTYVFFWDLEGNQPITSENLEQNLSLYFKGLCKAVGEAKKLTIDTEQIHTQVIKAKSLDPGHESKYKDLYSAKITIFDTFNKGEKVELNAEIAVLKTKQENKTVLFFCVSPKSYQDDIWQQMFGIRDSLKIN